MVYTLPDTYVIGGSVALVVLTVFAILVRKTSWNYVWPRLKQQIRGGKFIHEIDLDNNSSFACVPCSLDVLQCKDRLHTIEPISSIRNPDGTIYYVHKDLEKALTPHVIYSVNKLNRFGFQSLAHALNFYKIEYFSNDWVDAQKQIDIKPEDKTKIIQQVEEKIGLSLMAPLQNDYFTQNLAIVNRWNNQKLSAYGSKNIADKIRNEAEKTSRGGLSGEKLMTYVVAIVALIIGVAFALIVLKSMGVIDIGGSQQVINYYVAANSSAANITK